MAALRLLRPADVAGGSIEGELEGPASWSSSTRLSMALMHAVQSLLDNDIVR